MFVSGDNESSVLERVMSRVPTRTKNKEQLDVAPQPTSDVSDSADDPKWKLQGILAQTCVTTNFGKVPAHLIRVGDRVRTRSGRYLRVCNIHEYKLDIEYVERHPEALPVLIQRGALDGRYPTQDVLLSSEQFVTFDGKHAQPDMIHAREIPRGRRTVDATFGLVAYYKFELEEPAEMYCEGIWVKSATEASRG